MRRTASFAHILLKAGLLPVGLLPVGLLLSGCSGSGFWRYEADTLTLPGANPNRPDGASETYRHVRHAKVTTGERAADPAPLLTEAGDIWPGPPPPILTLRDLQKQTAGIGSETGGEGMKPLPPLPSLPGFEITAPQPGPVLPPSMFPQRSVRLPGGRNVPATGGQGFTQTPAPAGNGSIIVPNGNGTSTVIGPNGNVSTIPTPPSGK